MIENIYSNMGGKEGEYLVSGRRPPKNVRQIGFFSGDFRIYVEDYVHTFTHWLAEQDHSQRCVAVFVGEFAKSEHAREVYAYGAVVAEHACDSGKIEMTAQVWTKIYETIKEFFPDGEIVGWFCGGTSFTDEEREEIRQVHLDHFAGTDRILMLYDFLDREEEFYRYEESGMARQDGYYIYYEKNTEMQEYMIQQKQGKGSEENVNDRAVQEMRARWNNTDKQEAQEGVPAGQGDGAPGSNGNRLLYLVGLAMSAVAIIAAASMLYNQERLKGFEQTLNRLIGNVEDEPDAQEAAGKVDGQGQTEKDKDKEGAGAMSWGAPDQSGARNDGEQNPTPTDVDDGKDAEGGKNSGSGGDSDSGKNSGNSGDSGNGNDSGGGEGSGSGGDSDSGKNSGNSEDSGNGNDSDGGKDSGNEGDSGNGRNSGNGGNSSSEGNSGSEKDSGNGGNSGSGEDSSSGNDSTNGNNSSNSSPTTPEGDKTTPSSNQNGNDTSQINDDKKTGKDDGTQTDNSKNAGTQSGDDKGSPGSVPTAEIGGSGPVIDTSNMQFYIVKPGDTLTSICRKLYGNLDNLEYIKGLNQLNDENLIYVDQELLVP